MQQCLGTTKHTSLLLDSNAHHHPLLLLPTWGPRGNLSCTNAAHSTSLQSSFSHCLRTPAPRTQRVSYLPSPFSSSPSDPFLFQTRPCGAAIIATILAHCQYTQALVLPLTVSLQESVRKTDSIKWLAWKSREVSWRWWQLSWISMNSKNVGEGISSKGTVHEGWLENTQLWAPLFFILHDWILPRQASYITIYTCTFWESFAFLQLSNEVQHLHAEFLLNFRHTTGGLHRALLGLYAWRRIA